MVERRRDGAARASQKTSKARRRRRAESDEDYRKRIARLDQDLAAKRKKVQSQKTNPIVEVAAVFAPTSIPPKVTRPDLSVLVSDWTIRQRQRVQEMDERRSKALLAVQQFADQSKRPEPDPEIAILETSQFCSVSHPTNRSKSLNLQETSGVVSPESEVGGVYIPKGYINTPPNSGAGEHLNSTELLNKPSPASLMEEKTPLFGGSDSDGGDTSFGAGDEGAGEPLAPVVSPRLLLGQSVEVTVREAGWMAVVTAWLVHVRLLSRSGAQTLRFGSRSRWQLDRALERCSRLVEEPYEPEKKLSSSCAGYAVFAVTLGRATAHFASVMLSTTAGQLIRFVLDRCSSHVSFAAPCSPERVVGLYRAIVTAERDAGTFVVLTDEEET